MARGGWRYGAGRPGLNARAEMLRRIDVRDWKRRGYFQPLIERSFVWNWTRNGEPHGSINVLTTFERVTLSYRLPKGDDPWRDRREQVSIERTRCNYGGERLWFQCPGCARRCEVLYLRFGGFACRACNRVAYTSQSGATLDRLTHKLEKLQKRIEGGRSKGMRWATFHRLQARCIEQESIVAEEFSRRVAMLYAVKRYSHED